MGHPFRALLGHGADQRASNSISWGGRTWGRLCGPSSDKLNILGRANLGQTVRTIELQAQYPGTAGRSSSRAPLGNRGGESGAWIRQGEGPGRSYPYRGRMNAPNPLCIPMQAPSHHPHPARTPPRPPLPPRRATKQWAVTSSRRRYGVECPRGRVCLAVGRAATECHACRWGGVGEA